MRFRYCLVKRSTQGQTSQTRKSTEFSIAPTPAVKRPYVLASRRSSKLALWLLDAVAFTCRPASRPTDSDTIINLCQLGSDTLPQLTNGPSQDPTTCIRRSSLEYCMPTAVALHCHSRGITLHVAYSLVDILLVGAHPHALSLQTPTRNHSLLSDRSMPT